MYKNIAGILYFAWIPAHVPAQARAKVAPSPPKVVVLTTVSSPTYNCSSFLPSKPSILENFDGSPNKIIGGIKC